MGFNVHALQNFWHCVRGLHWKDVRNELIYLANVWPSPDLLIIHAGANDIGKFKTWNLLCEMKQDLFSFKVLFPSAIIAFSEMISRLLWSPSGNLFYLDKIRRHLNRTIHNFFVSSNNLSYRHIDLEGFLSGLYRSDLVHLSDIGLDIFNVGSQNIIEEATVLGGRQRFVSQLASAGGVRLPV